MVNFKITNSCRKQKDFLSYVFIQQGFNQPGFV